MIVPELDGHSHILPGIDDGPKTIEESLNMARMAVRVGFREVIATPHFEEGFYENDRLKIMKRVREFNKILYKSKIPLVVYPGSEIMLSPVIPELLKKGQLMTYFDDGQYVLVEFPLHICPLWWEDVLYRLRLDGYTVILAHPERYVWLQNDIGKIENLKKKQGLYLQSNLSSLCGKYGGKAKTTAELLKEKGVVDIWGSDAHSAHGYKVLNKQNVKI